MHRKPFFGEVLCAVLLGAHCSAFAEDRGWIAGRVVNTLGEPVSRAAVEMELQGRTALTDPNGTFQFNEVPVGMTSLVVRHVGYEEARREVEVVAGDTSYVAMSLIDRIYKMPRVEVNANPHTIGLSPPVFIAGRHLRESISGTVATTLAEVPGLSERSMGPAPARPVLRGLDGSRVLVLENGNSPGDLSATAPDHAVVVDPLGAESIEVVRGPMAFLHGSAVLGGVIDVSREGIFDSPPKDFQGSVRFHGSTVNSGGAEQVRVRGSIQNTGYMVDLVNRSGGDVRTAVGRLKNTGVSTQSAALGLGRNIVGLNWGILASQYNSDYGIPGGFLGGHANGVDIELERTRWEVRAAKPKKSSKSNRFELRASRTSYFHRELESASICGVSFGLLTHDGTGRLDFGEETGLHGSALASFEERDFASGCFSFITPTIERSAGLCVFAEEDRDKWSWQLAARRDGRWFRPSDVDTNKAGIIRDRSFAGFAGGALLAYHITSDTKLALGINHTWRPPAIEELFSEGPHLAAYSYEIGNAELNAESAEGIDVAIESSFEFWDFRGALFRNTIRKYILPLDTGDLEYGQGSSGFLPRYQYQGKDALFHGGEASFRATFGSPWEVEGSLAAVRAKFTENDRSVPRIPPVNGRLRVGRTFGPWFMNVGGRGASKQTRLGDFEEATAAWATLDASVAWQKVSMSSGFLAIVLRGTNLTNVAYRNHLSRVKSVMPEAGRSISISLESKF